MSIFDIYQDQPLPGDRGKRSIPEGALEYDHFAQENVGEKMFSLENKSLKLPMVLCLLVFMLLVGQLLRLQIAQGNFNRILAEGNRIRSKEVVAPRGLIIDSKGENLAKNIASYSLYLYPLDFPRDQKEKEDLISEISRASQIPAADIRNQLAKKGLSSADPVILKENIDRDTAMLLEVKIQNMVGVEVAKKPIREYEDVLGLGQILGYVGRPTDKDLEKNPNLSGLTDIGKEGLELYYENIIKGKPGKFDVEVDSKGRQQRQLSSTAAEPGNNLILSLNAGLERKMVTSLATMVKMTGSPGGAAVALNPQNGEILAIASIPTYDNNLFARPTAQEEYLKLASDPNNPMFNRAVSGAYPSGSIVKPVVASAGLQEKVISANTTINDPGEIKVGSWIYPDWKEHGLVDVRKAISESCNVFFYAVAGGWDKIKGLGVEKLTEYLKKFGYSQKTDIDLPGEVAGLVPSPDWKKENKKEMWYLGDTYHLGIGQGDFLVTPLQMARAVSAIANGGELLKPHLVKEITDKDGKQIQKIEKTVQGKVGVDDQNLQIVREGMRQSVTSGSSKALNNLAVMAAAKTGTAQFGNQNKTHAWMEAYAPYKNPEIVVVVLVEGGGEGYAAAGPVVWDTLNWYFANK